MLNYLLYSELAFTLLFVYSKKSQYKEYKMITQLTRFSSYMCDSTARILRISRDDLIFRLKTIYGIAIEIFKLSIAAYFNPYLAMCGLGVGLLFPEATCEKLNRIWKVVESRKWCAIPILILSKVLFLPMPFLGISVYIGARLGSNIMHLDIPNVAEECKS